MNETQKTTVYAAVAGALLLLAVVTRTWSPASEGAPQDEGQPFFPALTDFTKATSLEVVGWDKESGATPFKVELKGGKWVIPSKNDYPADGKDRLGKVAAAVLDLRRDSLRSESETDQVAMGVVDPTQETGGDEGRGQRITMRDAGGQVLADFILGKSVESSPDLRYVRLPAEKRIYAVRADGLEPSTKFEDWIERDLVSVDVAAITTITVNKYSVDEELMRARNTIRIIDGERLVLGKKDGQWALGDQKPEEKLVQYKVSDVTDAFDKLEIVDVTPFDDERLQAAGFYLARTQGGRTQVYSNEGEVVVECDDGVAYVVRFGEVLPGESGEEGLRRWVVLQAYMNEAGLPRGPDGAVTPEARKKAEERAKELDERFGQWFYVISAKSYDGLRPKRDDLLEKDSPPGDEHGPDDGHDHGGEGFPPVPDDQAPGVDAPQGPPAPPASTEQAPPPASTEQAPPPASTEQAPPPASTEQAPPPENTEPAPPSENTDPAPPGQ